MTTNKHHMLDTNVILAMVMPSDSSFEDAKEYLKTRYTRYISESSTDEAETKIANIQIISLDISEFIKKYSIEKHINYMKIYKEKSKVKNYLKINIKLSIYESTNK